MRRAESRAHKVRQTEKLLLGLLRTPKTRAGLIAATVSKGVTRNYLYGWLSNRRRDGTVAVLKSPGVEQFQLASCVVQETPAESLGFPAWLEPRVLPMVVNRHVFIDGKRVKRHETDR